MAAPVLMIQTTYAELLERCAAVAFDAAFAEDGTFTSKTIKGRRYWYFQIQTPAGRSQRYVGPETPELLEQIAHHKRSRDDERERRSLVSTLVRSFNLPRPIPLIGEIVSALADAGVFRLRGVLIGTVAYQTYPAMLGTALPSALLQTSDVDIAQFTNVSIAVGDNSPPMLEVLKKVDASFREVPHTKSPRWTTSYIAKAGIRVDFLTPNEGADSDDPQTLPALQTDAQPLRFMDFLIHAPVHAVVLHGAGICVEVPSPERFAIHKLILAQRRTSGVPKRDKDLMQASALIGVLSQKQALELKMAWDEAYGRGPTWRRLLLAGTAAIDAPNRDLLLKIVGRARNILPAMELSFGSSTVRYDSNRDVVTFSGEAFGAPVECAVSREAMEDYFGANGLGKDGRVQAFLRSRSRIEEMTRTKYLSCPIEEINSVLLRTIDVERLRRPGI